LQDEEFADAAMEYRLTRWSAYGKKGKVNKNLMQQQQKRKARLDAQSERVKIELKSRTYKRMIMRLGEDFDEALSIFMHQLTKDAKVQAHAHLVNLQTRLDYNEFISTTSTDTSFA
jgi:hypothetical protein